MSSVIRLERGKEITIKRLGAKGQAEVLAIIGAILDSNYFTVLVSDFSKADEKSAVENLGYINRFITSMCTNNIDDIFRLVCLVSSLDQSDLETDGDDSVHIADIPIILKEAWRVNDSEIIKKYVKDWFGDKLEKVVDHGRKN